MTDGLKKRIAAFGMAGLAGAWLVTGCIGGQSVQGYRRPSMAFIADCRVAFEQSLADGDLDGAERALERMDGRNVEDTGRRIQLGTARRIQALLDRGRQEMAEGRRAALEETYGALESLRAEVYRGEFYWPEPYLVRMEQDFKAFREDALPILRNTEPGRG